MSTVDSDPELLYAALRCMGDAMFIVTAEGRIAFFSRRAEELTGLRAAHVVGRTCAEVEPGGLCGIQDAVLGGAALDHDEFPLRSVDGLLLRAHRSVRPIRGADGTLLGAVVTFHVLRPGEDTAPPRVFASRGQADPSHPFVGRSPAVRKIVDTIRRVGPSNASVLIMGESGTGKELVARSIHDASRRRARALVAVNCAAIPHNLLESELFGHVRGAFTGAMRDRRGSLEIAEGGTLFLDEIGDLPLHMQAKLLRLLQERTYQRVGDSRTVAADVRIVAATNVDLDQAVAQGRFRQDLYFRLCVIPIRIPPLRERREDIAPLASFLLARRSMAAGRLPMRFAPATLSVLEDAPWEGNVRQLINVVDYVVALCDSSMVQVHSLPEDFSTATRGLLPDRRGRYQPSQRGDAEARLIRATLRAQGYHRQRTAEALGMDRVTLYRKMRSYGISPHEDDDDTD